MSYQDWEPVTIGGGNIVNDKKNITKNVVKKTTENLPGSKLLRQLENDDGSEEKVIIPKVSLNDAKNIQTKRNIANLTKKELAKLLNIQSNIINDIENGKCANSKALINKINIFLDKYIKKNISTTDH